jgi:hypothetical protein
MERAIGAYFQAGRRERVCGEEKKARTSLSWQSEEDLGEIMACRGVGGGGAMWLDFTRRSYRGMKD